jgi:hypothetical protein
MKFSAERNTLAYHTLARPLMSRMDFGGIAAKAVGQAAKKYRDNATLVSPESEALRFYLAHQIVAAIKKRRRLHEPLPQEEVELVEESIRQANDVFLRMLYYVTVICLRECRHTHDADVILKKAKGQPFEQAINFVAKSIPDSAIEAMKVFLTKVPEDLTMQHMADAMAFVFHKGKWGSSYGGPAWGNIADNLSEVARGDLSPEMFCDVSFALAHNGGPIFNKGMFYSQWGSDFGIILDVQRGGQIPQYISSHHYSGYVTQEVDTLRVAAYDVLGDEFGGVVDWQKVLDAGAINEHVIVQKAGNALQSKAEKAKQAVAKHIKATVKVLPGKEVLVTDRAGVEVVKKTLGVAA